MLYKYGEPLFSITRGWCSMESHVVSASEYIQPWSHTTTRPYEYPCLRYSPDIKCTKLTSARWLVRTALITFQPPLTRCLLSAGHWLVITQLQPETEFCTAHEPKCRQKAFSFPKTFFSPTLPPLRSARRVFCYIQRSRSST